MLVKEKNGWHVYSENKSRHLGGPYQSKAQAEKRLRQVEFFKKHPRTKKSHPWPGRRKKR